YAALRFAGFLRAAPSCNARYPRGAAGVSSWTALARTSSKEDSYPPKGFSTQRGGRLVGPVFRPEVVLGSGEKAVDVVERRHPSGPRICRKLSEARDFPQGWPLTQA